MHGFGEFENGEGDTENNAWIKRAPPVVEEGLTQ